MMTSERKGIALPRDCHVRISLPSAKGLAQSRIKLVIITYHHIHPTGQRQKRTEKASNQDEAQRDCLLTTMESPPPSMASVFATTQDM